MKSIFLVIYIKIILIIFIYTNDINQTNSNYTIISDSIVKIFDNEIKADIVLHKNKKGVILKLNLQNEKRKIMSIMKEYSSKNDNYEEEDDIELLTEKTNFFIDYRLFNNCDFQFENFFGNNNEVEFQINKLENKNEILNYDMEMEKQSEKNIINPKQLKIKFKLEKLFTNKKIFQILSENCKARKTLIKTMKDDLEKFIKNQIENKIKIQEISKKISQKNSLKDNLDNSINTSKSFFSEKQSLKKLNEQQMSYLISLKDKSFKIMKSQKIEKIILDNKIKNSDNAIKEKERIINLHSEKVKDFQNDLSNLNKDTNLKENELINLQKKLIDMQGIFDKIKTEKLSVELEFSQIQETRKLTLQDKNEAMAQLDKIKSQTSEFTKLINNYKDDKNIIQKQISKSKEDVFEIDRKINELLRERNKKVETINNIYENLKKKEDEIFNQENELNVIIYKKSLFEIKLTEENKKLGYLESKEKFTSNRLNETSTKYEIYSDNISYINKAITAKELEINDLKTIITKKKTTLDKLTNKMKDLANEKNQMLNTKSILDLDKRRLDANLNYNDIQIKNFEFEIKNIKYKELINNFQKSNTITSNIGTKNARNLINEDLRLENSQLEKEILLLKSELKSLKLSQNENKNTLENYIELKLKKEIPKADIILDLINEEMNNLIIDNISLNNLIDKFKNFIEKIKS